MCVRDGEERELASSSLGGGHVHEWAEIGAGVFHAFRVLELESGVAALTCLWPGGVK